MKSERILTLLGYDRELLVELSRSERQSMCGAGLAWLFACAILGLLAAQAAWLVQPRAWVPCLLGPAVALLMLNLLRVVNAGGGCELGASQAASLRACRDYRPSIVPALVFGVLAAILAQPGQLAFWPGLDSKVESHRQELIAQHNRASEELGNDAAYYGAELQTSQFPVFRLKLMWQEPRRALRLTGIMCLLVLLPGFWSQAVSIRALRSFEWQRAKRRHAQIEQLTSEGQAQQMALLAPWLNKGTR